MRYECIDQPGGINEFWNLNRTIYKYRGEQNDYINKLLSLEWIPKSKFTEKSDEAKNLKEQIDAQTKLI